MTRLHQSPEADLLRGGKVTGGSDDELAIIKGPAGMVDNLGRPGWWRGWGTIPGLASPARGAGYRSGIPGKEN